MAPKLESVRLSFDSDVVMQVAAKREDRIRVDVANSRRFEGPVTGVESNDSRTDLVLDVGSVAIPVVADLADGSVGSVSVNGRVVLPEVKIERVARDANVVDRVPVLRVTVLPHVVPGSGAHGRRGV